MKQNAIVPKQCAKSSSHPIIQIVIGFLIFSAVLVLAAHCQLAPNPMFTIRSGALSDLIREMPIGRQSLVSSLYVMPLPSLMALPFTPFLRPEMYGYAYLYGVALFMAFSVPAMTSLLRRLKMPFASGLGLVILAALAYALGASIYSDILICIAAVILALYFESATLPILKALAGVFWGLALVAHPVGIFVVGLWVFIALIRRVSAWRNHQRKAIHRIQTLSVIYAAGVYLFLNWMIMGDAFYSLHSFHPDKKALQIVEQSEDLSQLFAADYSSYVPVVSGHWGYLVQPFLHEYHGYHFMDFYPDKLPSWEDRTPILIVPTQENPYSAICDLESRFSSDAKWNADYLLLGSNREWRFYVTRLPRKKDSDAIVRGEKTRFTELF